VPIALDPPKPWLNIRQRGGQPALPLIQKVARTIKKHLWGILNAILFQASNGASESMNSRIQGLKVQSPGLLS